MHSCCTVQCLLNDYFLKRKYVCPEKNQQIKFKTFILFYPLMPDYISHYLLQFLIKYIKLNIIKSKINDSMTAIRKRLRTYRFYLFIFWRS